MASAWEFEKALFETHAMSHKNERLEFPHPEEDLKSPSAPGILSEVADIAGLEAAGHAKDVAQPSGSSSLNVKKLESLLAQPPLATDASPQSPAASGILRTDASEASSEQSQSGLNIKKLEAALAQAPVATEVADAAGLEAAVHAKDVATPSAGSSLNVKKLEAALAQTPAGTDAAPQSSSLNVRKLEDALAQPPVQTEASPQSPAQYPASEQGLNIKKLEAALAQAPVATEVADTAGLEAAGHAKDVAASPPKSSLNVKKLEDALAQTPVGTDISAQAPAAAPQQSSLNVKKLEAALAQPPVAADVTRASSAESMPVPDAPSAPFQTEVADVAGLEAAGHLKDIVAESQTSKFSLKRSSEGPAEVGVYGPHLLTPEGEAPAKKTKKQVMHDMPHYRNHGAAMAHVETPRKAMSAEHEALAKEKAAKIAERRAEVQSAFHTSKANTFSNPSPGLGAVPASAEQEATFFQTLFICGCLLSVAGLAYHKFEAIYDIYSGGSNLKKHSTSPYGFRAMLDREEESYAYGATVTGGHLSPMAGGRQGLARRGSMDHCDYGV